MKIETMTKRKTSGDYRKERLELRKQLVALENRIRCRAKEMIEQNPKVIVSQESNVVTGDYLNAIHGHSIATIFQLMEIIEAELTKKHPHKQIKIDFKTE
jgi:hypothetical protein